jgi:FKBP-type peptidyl-prolyl cis-trans isomerase
MKSNAIRAAAVLVLAGIGSLATAQKLSGDAKKAVDALSKNQQPTLQTLDQKVSYAVGLDVLQNLTTAGLQVDLLAFLQGAIDGLDTTRTKLVKEDETEEIFAQFQTVMMERQKKQADAAASVNIEAGKKFMAAESGKSGMNSTESGLMYEVVKLGEGPRPTAESTVKVNYEGTLIDGTKFDSSYDRGQPAQFPLSGVIRGWTEGLQLMPVGSTFRFIIPADLAYGNNAPPGSPIKPGSTLVFKVELLEIVAQ